jgi:hypothetical protein
MMTMRLTPTLAALALALAAGAAAAQDAPVEPQPPAPREVLLKMLDQAIPRFDEAILVQPDTPDWTGKLDLRTAARALNAEALAGELQRAPNGTEAVQTDAAALQVDPARGYVRYVDRRATVDLSNDLGPLPDQEKTFRMGMELLARLGLPAQEFAKPAVETQMAAGGSAGAERPERVDEVYRLFVVERVVNDLPVFGSNAVVAVTDRAEVQRARAEWPAFRMDRTDKLLDRGAVLEEAADALVDSGVSEKAAITARLGYAPVGGLPGAPYVPVAMIAVVDGETPLLVSAPLVEPGDADEQ